MTVEGLLNYLAPFIIVLMLGLTFYFLGKRLSVFTIKGKTYRIPPAIPTVLIGVVVGVILRAINPEYSIFQIAADGALLFTIMLFLSLGISINFRAFKKYGAWSLILGTIPYLIEWAIITLVIWPIISIAGNDVQGGALVSAALVSSLLALCSPGLIIPAINTNIKRGYEKEIHLNETLAFASAIENVLACFIIIIFSMMYMATIPALSDTGGIVPIETNITASMIALMTIIFISIGIVMGIIIALIMKWIFIPFSRLIYKPSKFDLSNYEGEELEEKKQLNEKSEKRSNIIVFVMVSLVYLILFYAFQYTLGIGFLTLEIALVHGLVISKLSENNISLTKTQGVVAQNSSAAFNKYACYYVWGFGGSLIVPAVLFGSTWVAGIPNILFALIIVLVGIMGRVVGLFVTTIFTNKFTVKHKMYSLPIMLTTGTPGLNNAVSMKAILPQATSPTVGGITPISFVTIEFIVVSAALQTLVLIPLGSILCEAWRDKYIFAWETVSNGTFTSELSATMKKEKINKATSKEIVESSKEYWEKYFKVKSLEKREATPSKEMIKDSYKIADLENSIKAIESKIATINLAVEDYKISQKNYLAYEKNFITEFKYNLLEKYILTKIDNFSKKKKIKTDKLMRKLKENKNDLSNLNNKRNADLLKMKSKEPSLELKTKREEYNSSLTKLKELVAKNVKDEKIASYMEALN